MVSSRMVLFDAQAITSSVVYSNSVQSADTNMGAGEPVEIDIWVDTDFAGGTSLVFALQESDDDSTFTDVIITRSFTRATPAELAKSTTLPLIRMYVPTIGPTPLKAYLRLRATPTGTFTAGKVNAFLHSRL